VIVTPDDWLTGHAAGTTGPETGGLNLKRGPGFSVRVMRVNQVTAELTVGQLASRAGVRTDTIRYYEREGLLPVPQRRSGRAA
jgi:MerR family regulatory protein